MWDHVIGFGPITVRGWDPLIGSAPHPHCASQLGVGSTLLFWRILGLESGVVGVGKGTFPKAGVGCKMTTPK